MNKKNDLKEKNLEVKNWVVNQELEKKDMIERIKLHEKHQN
jgi:hypothetical protein